MTADLMRAGGDRTNGVRQRLARVLTGPVTTSVALALVIGAIIIALSGANPLHAYQSLVSGSLTGRGLADTFERAIPIVGMALAVAVAFRAGVFNLGAEGQMVLGALAGALVALKMPGPGVLVMLLAVLVAVLVGGLWGVLSAVLQTRVGVPILITSLLLNYPARYLASYLVRFPFKDNSSSLVATVQVPDGTRIGALIPAKSELGRSMSRSLGADNTVVLLTRSVDWSLLVVIALIVAVIVFNNRTAAGFETGIAGLNPEFARYGGVGTDRMSIGVMFTSGGMAGLVGIMLILGGTSQYRVIDGALVGTNYAWTGLLVALLAASRPIGVVVAGCFFAVLVVGGEAMQRSPGVASQIAQVIQAMVIILLAFRVTIGRRRSRTRDPDESMAADEPDVEVGKV